MIFEVKRTRPRTRFSFPRRPPLFALRPTSDLRFPPCPCRAVTSRKGGSLPPPRFSPISSHVTRHTSLCDAFTLIELLVVIAIISVLMVLVVPAINNLKTAGDVTNAAYTVKGILEVARTRAKANNTYTWIGLYEESAATTSSSPPTPGTGRVIVSVVESIDGTTIYTSSSAPIDPTRLRQVGKLTKIENVHLPLFAVGSGTGDSFDTRPAPDFNSFVQYNSARFGELNAGSPNTAPRSSSSNNTSYPFQYPVGNPAPAAQYTFTKTLQFSPKGECRIFSTYDVRRVVEIGLVQTHATATPVPTSGSGTSLVTFSGNVAAVQITGFGNVKVFRR